MCHCERFGSERESRRSCHLGSESQDQDRHETEGDETEEENDEATKKGILPTAK